MSVPPVTVPGGSSYPDVVGDNIITADVTDGADLITIIAANGTDTIFGGGGDLIVDASANTLSVDVAPAFGGATTIQGGSGTLLVEPDNLGMEGYLTVHLADGAATINGSTAGTSIFAGMGDIQIIADGELSITGNDGAETLRWTPTLGDVINVTTDSGGVTTMVDTGTNISVSLFDSEIIVDATAVSGTISDFANVAGTEIINLGANPVTVMAANGTDTINAGTGDLTVDATGNGNPIVVDGTNADQLAFTAGTGDATITGGLTSTIVNGGVGTITLTQHGETTIHAGDGIIRVTADGSQLTVIGEDGTSSTVWTVASGHTVEITSNPALQTTTLADTVTGAQTDLAHGYATNYISNGSDSTVSDLPDHNVINLSGGPVTVTASQGTDTIYGNTASSVTVNAQANPHPVTINGGVGPLTVMAGSGPTTISGTYAGTTVTGGAGTIALTQRGATTIHTGDGIITVTSDGTPLTVFGADGVSNGSWPFLAGDTVTITTDSVTHVTTVTDPNGSLSYTLPATVPPTVTIDPINGGVTLNAGAAAMGLTVSGTTTGVEDGQTVTISVSNGIDPPFIYSPTVTDGVWSVTIPTDVATSLLDGSHTITANVSNQANDPAVAATQTLTVDETAPMVAITSIAPVGTDAAAAGFAISGTTDAEDAQTVTVTIWDGGIPLGSFTGLVGGNAWSVVVDPAELVGPLANGNYTVTAEVSDLAGNAAAPTNQNLPVDEIAPVVTIDSLGGPINQSMQTVTGTATEIGGTITVWDGLATVGSAMVGDDGHWTATNVTLTGEGPHSLVANETDAAGNTGASTAVTYTLDLTPPTVTIASIDPVNAATAAAGFTISGTTNAEDGRMVSVQIVDSDENPVGSPYPATVANGAWSVTVPSTDHLADGSYTVTAG
ncbi:MAG TPA: Ig-like domain-containing protein, partial [Acetobacteraceae bacterium]|nr:Ig-like domain-containing protein [Acetobacteraceae bacterium]